MTWYSMTYIHVDKPCNGLPSVGLTRKCLLVADNVTMLNAYAQQ